ncbi:sigma 54-interacting transcriptional regulator [Ornithinibacillus sp. 4-3]|uniref:Sigma 54-interacting transcriptional regulator n=1 Tax=Ornithinibacillus sp. 4-3 TaxID=3231488 RepID=A0AB39HM02_9BACI
MNTLNELQAIHKFIIDYANIGIHAINKHGITVIYNQKMGEIEGLQPGNVIQRRLDELVNFDNTESTLLRVLHTKNPLYDVEQTYWNLNGDEITTVNTTMPIFEDGEIIGAVEYASDISHYRKYVLQPVKKHSYSETYNKIIAESKAMQEVLVLAEKAASTRLPLLIIGETGTGKDLIAERIHMALEPKNNSFYTLLCQAVDERWLDQLASELENEKQMTLFCERIDLLPLHLQPKLLHLLEQYKNKDHLLIASVDDDPVELISKGALQKNLFYLFSNFTINISPLRERVEDIEPFIQAFFVEHAEKFGTGIPAVHPDVLKLLLKYDWPGNIRELQHLLEEIITHDPKLETITNDVLPMHFLIKQDKHSILEEEQIPTYEVPELTLESYLLQAEKYYIGRMMKKHGNNITKTAEALGMSRQNLQYRLKKIRNQK